MVIYFSQKNKIGEIFEGEMFIRTLKTTFLEIFWEITLNLKVIIKSIIYPDNNIKSNPQAVMC